MKRWEKQKAKKATEEGDGKHPPPAPSDHLESPQNHPSWHRVRKWLQGALLAVEKVDSGARKHPPTWEV